MQIRSGIQPAPCSFALEAAHALQDAKIVAQMLLTTHGSWGKEEIAVRTAEIIADVHHPQKEAVRKLLDALLLGDHSQDLKVKRAKAEVQQAFGIV